MVSLFSLFAPQAKLWVIEVIGETSIVRVNRHA